MSQYNGMVLTAAGLQLEAKAQTGVLLHFTRVALGDGQLASGQILSALTNLIDWKMDLPIIAKTVSGTGTATLQAVLQNTNLSAPFFAREIGVFANDPDAGEILYSVANAGNNADQIPAGGGSDIVELVLEIITVIGQATNVTADINSSLLFVTTTVFNEFVNSPTNPFPNWLQVKAATTSPSHFWTQENSDGALHPMTLDNVKRTILGGDDSDLSNLQGQVNQIQREQANQALALKAQAIYPTYNTLLADDFNPVDAVDQFTCQVTGVAAGDDSLDLSTLVGIIEGSTYTISDGVNQEDVQIVNIIKNETTLRAICAATIVNTYDVANTYLYRSTVDIANGVAVGAGGTTSTKWEPTLTYSGATANQPVTLDVPTTVANASAFTITGDIGFTSDGMITLV